MPQSNISRPFAFRRMVVFGYYDAPTDGVTETLDQKVYRFSTVSRDIERDESVMALAEMPTNSMAALCSALELVGPAAWPVWVPLWRFSSKADEEETNQAVDAILSTSGPVVVLLLTADISKTIQMEVAITPQNRFEYERLRSSAAEFERWRKFLNAGQ